MKSHRLVGAAVLLATCWLAAPATARAQASLTDFLRTNPKFLHAFHEVAASARGCAVHVQSRGKDVALGVIVGEDGLILTKAFDLKGTLTCRLKDGDEFEATIVGVHPVHDLALLKIDAKDLPVARFRASRAVPVGSWVASIGTGEDPIAVGVVSVPTRDVAFKGLPIAAAELSKIGYLGVALEPAGGAGVRVIQVMPNTPAAKAGLKTSDIIVRVGGEAVNDPEQFQAQMVKRKAGDRIILLVQRDDEELELDATLQQRPAGDNRGELQNRMGSDLSARRSGYPTILTHDSVIKPGDCGGPLVDLDGNVVGINISRAGRTESWAIPTEVIESLLPELRSGKLAPHRPTSPADATTVPALSPAEPNAGPRPDADDRSRRR